MRIGLLADIENRAAPVLYDLDYRTLLGRLWHLEACVGPDGHEFTFAHDNGRAVCPGFDRTAGRNLRAATRRPFTALVANGHATVGFADRPGDLCVDARAGEQEGERSSSEDFPSQQDGSPMSIPSRTAVFQYGNQTWLNTW